MVDAGNRERGLKAALHNPRVSEQAKQRDREILETEFGEHFEEGGTISEPDMVSPEGAASSSGLGELSDDYSYLESPPTPVKQTVGLRSSSKPDASAKSRTTTTTSKMMSSSEMMEGGGTTSRRAPVLSSSSSSSMKTRSASAGHASASTGRSSKRESIQGTKDTGNVYVWHGWSS
jgi:hypothetical protein